MYKEFFIHTLDESGRVAIPAKWRKHSQLQKGKTLILTRGFDVNLFLFTEEDWDKYVESRVSSLSIGEDSVRDFLRFFFSGAAETVIDASGRIVIPQSLISYAKLSKEIVMNGSGFYMEIWSKELWDAYFSVNQERLKNFAKDFFKLPIQGKGYGENGTQERPG